MPDYAWSISTAEVLTHQATDSSERPLVSIVTIFLNAEKFMGEAITSVFSQSYTHWELLLVDDGSTDASTELAKRYARDHAGKVRYLEHEGHQNRGMSASRNRGIRHARGDLIAFLDSDDVWMLDKLQEQVAIMQQRPEVGMVCGRAQYWSSWADASAEDIIEPVGAPQDAVSFPSALMTCLYPLGDGSPPCPSELLLRRQLVEQVGGFEESYCGIYQLYEDQAFLAKVYLATPVFVSSRVWLRYRQHPESCVAQVTSAGKYHTVRRFFLNWLQEYLLRADLKDSPEWRALKKALRAYGHPTIERLARLPPSLVRRARLMASSSLRRTLPDPVYQWLRDRLRD